MHRCNIWFEFSYLRAIDTVNNCQHRILQPQMHSQDCLRSSLIDRFLPCARPLFFMRGALPLIRVNRFSMSWRRKGTHESRIRTAAIYESPVSTSFLDPPLSSSFLPSCSTLWISVRQRIRKKEERERGWLSHPVVSAAQLGEAFLNDKPSHRRRGLSPWIIREAAYTCASLGRT